MKDKLDKAYGSGPGPATRSEEKTPASEGAGKPRNSSRLADPKSSGRRKGQRVGLSTEQRRQENLETEQAEALLKTGVSGTEKAAKFLLLLGQEEAAKVIRHMKPEEIERVSRAIAKIDRIDTAEANDILIEFGWLVKTQGASIEGGPQTARNMLAAAFGDDKAREFIRKAVPETAKPFQFLNDFDRKELASLFRGESPEVMSVLLPYLDPRLASALIVGLSESMRSEVVRRIARLEKVDPDVLLRMEEVVREKIRRAGHSATEEVDGRTALASILRHLDTELEENILDRLGEENRELSDSIRERLFTLDDIMRVPDREVQKRLRDLSEREIALVLKGKSAAFRDKLFQNVSQTRRIIIQEEYDILGAQRREDVEKGTRDFLGWFKKRWEDGELALDGDEDLVD
ncbi:MAG TPA: flagellar motor switch protein FliG [Magnetospirillaceae bacterium]|nr:flagellar motor switch protein FliG [Magnetospirillaceae bacterium]